MKFAKLVFLVAGIYDPSAEVTPSVSHDGKWIYFASTRCLLLNFASKNHLRSELLTNAIFLLSGDHEGTLIVPWPPYRYAITFGFPPAAGINRI